MLTISKPLNASQAQNYHAIEFTSPDQNYWSRGQTVQGEWQGRLAEKFGLSGGVGAEEFGRLAQGQHPSTGDQLVQHRQVHEYRNAAGEMVKSVEHRAGWDATFAAPKSVSLTALVGGDDRVRIAHREAVTAALTELERYTQARIGSNHPAETTGQFVAAKFEHDTARPVDGYAAPQLHTHAVIFNMTERTDGTPRALQPQSLFASQQFATAVYQSELMYRLRNLGYEIQPGRSGAPEIKGYTQEYLDASSPRSQQIREYMERRGFQGYESAEIAAHSTRDAKKIHPPAEVYAAHRQLAAEFGNQADQVVAAARARSLTVAEQRPKQVEMRAQEAVTWARDKVLEREAVGDERGIFRDALRRGMGEIRYPEIRANFEARTAAGEFQQVEAPKHASGRAFTTQQVIGAERDVIRVMRNGQGQAPQIMPIQQAVAHTDSYSYLNSSQRHAIEEVLVSRDRVQGLQGFAGVGKSASLLAVREGAERNGYVVEGLAPTSRAARQLRDSGISSDTLQGFLARGGQQVSGDPAPRHLYLLDESSLAGTRQMREFLTRLGPADRVLLIGDTRQHQGVEAGKPFEQLVEAGMRTAQLDQIVRQKTPELKAAVEQLARGDVAAGIDMLQRQGRVTEIADPAERIRAIANDYAAKPENTLIVSPDNASRREINDAVRHELQARGMVNVQDYSLRILVPRQELTGAERQWASRYEPGDVIRYARGSKDAGIEPGSYARVVAVNPTENLLSVEKQNAELATYDPKRLRGVSVYRELEREFAIGDRVQFTAPDKQLQVANRDLAAIQAISPDGKITARLDDGRSIAFSNRDNPHFDHGYAVTSHSSQGLTADRVLVNVDTSVHPDLINARFAYVSVSRASQDARIYTNDAPSLGKDLSHDVSKSTALEISQSVGQSAAERSQGIRL
jgi:conjugative relaxase-like TrwC/TraI family protein